MSGSLKVTALACPSPLPRYFLIEFNQMKRELWLLALDGSKGAGKSTTSEHILKSHPKAIGISLDFVRKDIGIEGTSFGKNKIAFEEVKSRIAHALEDGKCVLLDCGLDDYRIASIKQLADKYDADTMFVFLTAPYEVLVERVRARDVTKGKELNLQRFDEVYKIVMHKDFSQYLVLDTSMLSVTQIAQKIMM